MSKKYGPLTKRELSDRLATVSDAEIEKYYRKRMWRVRSFYILGLTCGILVIPFVITSNLFICILLGIVGIVSIQYGRLQRERWQKTFESLMQIRGKPVKMSNGKMLYQRPSRNESEA